MWSHYPKCPLSNKYKYQIIKYCYGHRVSTVSECSLYSVVHVGRDSSRLAGELSLASDDLKMEPLASPMGARQTEAQKKCSTLGDRMMKTQGSMMEFTEMKRRAIRSRRWDSVSPMELRYTRIWEMGRGKREIAGWISCQCIIPLLTPSMTGTGIHPHPSWHPGLALNPL